MRYMYTYEFRKTKKGIISKDCREGRKDSFSLFLFFSSFFFFMWLEFRRDRRARELKISDEKTKYKSVNESELRVRTENGSIGTKESTGGHAKVIPKKIKYYTITLTYSRSV